jgi:hypothetical protein
MNFMIKLLGVILVCASLSACGGGSDSTAPIVSTATFSIDAARKISLATAIDLPWTLSGTVNGNAVSGSGTFKKSGFTAATFNGTAAQSITSVTNGTIAALGKSAPLTTTSTVYYDAGVKTIGTISQLGTTYVIEVLNSLPTAAKVGDTGTVSTRTDYSDIAKLVKVGSSTTTWALTADTPNTAVLTLTTVIFGKTIAENSTTTDVSKLTPAGATTQVSIETNINNQVLKLTF